MEDKYLLTQKYNQYNELKKKMDSVIKNLDEVLTHLSNCTNKLPSCYKGYADAEGFIKTYSDVNGLKTLIDSDINKSIKMELNSLSTIINSSN